MGQPPPSQLLLQEETSSAPSFFQPMSAASILNGMVKSHNSELQAPLSMGIPSSDSHDGVLGSGIPHGCVIGLSSDLSEGSGRILGLRLMVRDLLRYANRHRSAMVVDTTGTFPLATLLEVIKGCVGEINDGTTKTPAGQRMPWREKDIVEGLLERIGITRVFDLEGLWDVIGEIKSSCREEEEGDKKGEEEGLGRNNEEIGNESDGYGKEFVEEYDYVQRSTLGVGGEQVASGKEEHDDTEIREKTSKQPPSYTQSAQNHATGVNSSSSQDTQPAQKPAPPPPKSAPPEKLAPSTSSSLSPPPNSSRPEKLAPSTSSSLSPPPPMEEPETSSPLSSLPDSPSPPHSASSSSLRSELVIESTPTKVRMNTVLNQAYQGLSLPPSSISEDQEEAAAISPSPLPPSSPPIIQSHPRQFTPPTGGFETHMSEAGQRQNKDSESDSDSIVDSSSDTSSYLRSEHPSAPQNNAAPPVAQWQDSNSSSPPSFLLIDSLPPLLTQLFGTDSTDRTTAHRELAQLNRVLTTMSRSTTHPLTVILLNSTTIPSAAKSLDEHLMRSVFADSKAVPSFGAVYDGMVDITLLVSKVPRTQKDAEALYGGYGELCSYTNVLECLRDDLPDLTRWIEEDGIKKNDKTGKGMNREGRWGSFDVMRMDGEVVTRDPDLGMKS